MVVRLRVRRRLVVELGVERLGSDRLLAFVVRRCRQVAQASVRRRGPCLRNRFRLAGPGRQIGRQSMVGCSMVVARSSRGVVRRRPGVEESSCRVAFESLLSIRLRRRDSDPRAEPEVDSAETDRRISSQVQSSNRSREEDAVRASDNGLRGRSRSSEPDAFRPSRVELSSANFHVSKHDDLRELAKRLQKVSGPSSLIRCQTVDVDNVSAHQESRMSNDPSSDRRGFDRQFNSIVLFDM